MPTHELQLTLKRNSQGILDLWIVDLYHPTNSNFHNLYTTTADKGDIIEWYSESKLNFQGFKNIAPSLFTSGPTQLTLPPNLTGFQATVGDISGSYSLEFHGQTWDPKIRVISDKCKTNTRENTSSALANA